MKKKALIMTICAFALVSCGSNSTLIQGAGATFPAPIYTKIFADYSAKNDSQVTYQAIGSGGGIQNIVDGIVDFGATDAFIDTQSLESYKDQGIDILHIPAALAAVNFTYNIPGLSVTEEPLSLDPSIIYGIYAGEITTWNDLKIVALNPNITLPDLEIIPVYRSDSSGTTYTMSEFLTKASDDWSNLFGTGKTINWATGIGQKGNSSMMGYTKENEGAIAYVDYVYAAQNNFPIAKIKNNSGNFVVGDVEAATFAADGIEIPVDTRVSITDAKGPNAAPMATFSYLLVRQEQNYNNRTLEDAQALVKLLLWMYSDEAQQEHGKLYFSPMPPRVLELGTDIINSITYNGTPVVNTL